MYFGRKFIAFLLSLAIYTSIMVVALLYATITDLSVFSLAIAGSVTQIAGIYYAGNVFTKKVLNDNSNKDNKD